MTTTLLRIDASPRCEGSRSRWLADQLEARWRAAHPQGCVVVRDLRVDPPPHLDADAIEGLRAGAGGAAARSDALIGELRGATDLLISSPLYNLGMPSCLKAWLDHVVRIGHTIEVDADGLRARLAGRRAFVVTACGGVPGADEDFLAPHLRAALQMLGWAEVEHVRIAATTLAESERARHERLAMLALERLFAASEPAPRWQGSATADDRAMIATLRIGQAEAILARDADAYAALCSDDVCLMLPGHALVRGREALRERERELLRETAVVRFDKQPELVIVEGDTAVEVGHQRVELADARAASGVFAGTQKYTHVLRRGPSGWRFTVLMSNACE